jgi:hypothetical protein
MPKKIFISYAVEDKAIVTRIKHDVQAVGHIVWLYPAAINPGEKIIEEEKKGISDSDIVLIMESERSLNSEAVKKEFAYAKKLEKETGLKKLYFVRIDPKIPITKTTIQRIDLSGKDNYVSEFYRLMRKIDDHKDFVIKYVSKRYQDSNWYTITVWMEGDGLSQVQEVDYHLHNAIAKDRDTITKGRIGDRNFYLRFNTTTDEYVCAIIYLQNKTQQVVVEQILV